MVITRYKTNTLSVRVTCTQRPAYTEMKRDSGSIKGIVNIGKERIRKTGYNPYTITVQRNAHAFLIFISDVLSVDK